MISPFRKALKEIIIQNIADFKQQIRVNPFAVEEFIGVLPRASQLFCQPGDATALPMQFFFDKMADMRFFFHWGLPFGEPCAVGKQKGGIAFYAYTVIEARQSHCSI